MSKSKHELKPLIDEDGEVRELLLEDIRKFRPAAEVLPPSLLTTLGIKNPKQDEAAPLQTASARKQSEARKVAAKHYPFRCCVVCGLQLQASLTVAHLDHHAANNDPENIAYLCGTHHWMYDAGLYPIEAIKVLRAHWQKTGGKPDHTAR
jgi:predicted restriction endonuclease